MNCRDEFGVGCGDQLYSHFTLDPGLVKRKVGSVFDVGQQRPRLPDAIVLLYPQRSLVALQKQHDDVDQGTFPRTHKPQPSQKNQLEALSYKVSGVGSTGPLLGMRVQPFGHSTGSADSRITQRRLCPCALFFTADWLNGVGIIYTL